MDDVKIIEAQNVQKGDFLFNSEPVHPALKWVWVKNVFHEEGKVIIQTLSGKVTKDPTEILAIRKRS